MDARFLLGFAILCAFFLATWLTRWRIEAGRRAMEQGLRDAEAEAEAARAVQGLARSHAVAPLDASTGAPPVAAAHDPYRAMQARSDPDAALARLAAQGERQVQAKSALRHDQREWVRLGRLIDAMQLLPPSGASGAVPTEAEFPTNIEHEYQDDYAKAPNPALLAAAASKAQAERAWLSSLPFRVERYFDVLAEAPKAIFRLDVTVTLAEGSRAPSLDILRGVVHAHDVDASVVTNRDGTITILVGDNAVSLAGYYPYTVQKIAPYVHGLVTTSLLPLHGSHPIARVTIARS